MHPGWSRRVAVAAAVFAIGVGGISASAAAGPGGVGPSAKPLRQLLTEPGHHTHHGPNGETDVNVCSDATPSRHAHCDAHVRTDDHEKTTPARAGRAAPAATIGNGGAYDPAYLRSAYNAPSATGGTGQTVAIVIAYDNPTVESDLGYYRSFFGLPACTTANGCFRKVDQNGGTSYPAADSGWAQESALDTQMVSAMCPNCKIVLVEARSSYLSDLGAAVNTAVNVFGANVVSNSYGGGEYYGETSDEASYYNHPGVAVTASSGDNGYGVEFPAASRYVTAVGGTNLLQSTNTGTRSATETAWSGAGSGCSGYEPKPSWQTDSGCSGRTVADVSAVADPNTGVWVYGTYGSPGWMIFGGTSVAAPIVGAMYALAGNGSTPDTLSSYPYATTAGLNDVTSGTNGACAVSYLCTAVGGYDGPTGLGTPNGTPSFAPGAPATPTVPSAPQSPSAVAGNKKITVSWTAPASNGGSAVTSYRVYRGTTSGGAASYASTTSTSYVDTAVTIGVTYYYQATAINGVGESARSAQVGAKAVTVPSAVTNLVARSATTRGVTISWSAPANGSSAIKGYKVYRSRSSGTEVYYVTVVCTSSTCAYTDTNTTRGYYYYYKVAAYNAVGTGPLSNQAYAKAT